MARTRRHFLPGIMIGFLLGAAGVRAQDTAAPAGSLVDVPLPGGLARAQAIVGDRAAADRSQFLLEFIRRTYDVPIVSNTDRRTEVVRGLADGITRAGSDGNAGSETVPLPLGPAAWLNAVFAGRESPQTLLGAILRSRSTSLLYYGLHSLDDVTRAWIAAEPDLLAGLASKHAASFVVAAPAIRVSNGSMQVPGGQPGEAIWEALVGRQVRNPAAFLRAIVEEDGGRLAYFYAAMAQLPAPQARYALALDVRDAGTRVANARRLYAVFQRLSEGWKPEDQPLWRPAADPALLLGEVGLDETGALALAGSRRFWTAALDSGEIRSDDEARELSEGDKPDFVWLCERVFSAKPSDDRRRYLTVLFGSRILRTITPDNARDALGAVRAAGTHPLLVASLERARLRDVSSYARVARRAAQLSGLGGSPRAVRALAGFQGVLVVLTRAAVRGGLSPEALASALSSLAAIEIDNRGDYNGGLVRWLDGFLRDRASVASSASGSADVESGVLGLVAGPTPAPPRLLEWEGMRYRVDVSHAESVRITRLLGERSRPYLTAARRLVAVSDALASPSATADGIARQATALAEIVQTLGWDRRAPGPAAFHPSLGDKSLSERCEELQAAVRRAKRDEVDRLSQSVVALADDFFARGLIEVVYAIALGRPERSGLAIEAGDAAVRHDLGLRASGPSGVGPWEMPTTGSEITHGWRTEGSLLGLDITLANFSLVRLSSKMPPKPTLSEGDQRVLVEAVVLMEPVALTDGDRDAIVAAIGRGREQLAAVRTAAEATALARRIPLDAPRRSLLPWVAVHDPARLSAFLSPVELLWLGLDGGAIPGLDAWGSSGQSRLGCQCLRFPDRRPWDALSGRTRSGAIASAFPDLNLRLAELLAELKMPATLLAGVLAAATRDLIDNAVSRDDYDRRGPVEFVQALQVERVEQYLSFLTTDGPLVPVQASGPGGGR